jgi:hypothetical protein
MQRITIKRVRTWHYRKMRRYIDPSNTLAPSSPFPSWLDYTTNTSGYDFRKGQGAFTFSIRAFFLRVRIMGRPLSTDW